MLVRHDLDVESIGQMAQLPPDLSPLQVGAKGEFGGQTFTLIGRVRLNYSEGSWTEWCASFGDGRIGWVAEAQGFFMVSFERELPHELSERRNLKPKSAIDLDGNTFHLTDRRETTVLFSEGQLPFAAVPGTEVLSADFTSEDGRFACAELGEEHSRFFVGVYARFDDLKWSALRAVPGWSGDELEQVRNQTTSLQCPSCGGAVILRAAGLSMSATCGACGGIIDTSSPELTLIRRASSNQKIQPLIPIGRRGMLFGVFYELIGFQRVKDEYSGWSEYLLFNPWQGFAWLVTYNGHWSFVRRILSQPEIRDASLLSRFSNARYEGEDYRMFAASNVSTTYVLGEFYWKVGKGMAAHVTDFICPPQILSRESYPHGGEETWSHGVYVEPDVVEEAFGLEEPIPEPTGMYLNQPNPFAEKSRAFRWLVPFLLACLIAIQVVSCNRSANQQVLSVQYHFQPGLTNPIAVTPPFEIKGTQPQAVEFTLQAPVQNSWLELGIDVVNTRTHQVAAAFEEGIEFYSGYDGGYWKEGSQSERRLVPSLPPGEYQLVIDATADPALAEMPFTIRVARDVVVWSNFWIALALVLLYPVYCWMRSHAFERARWMESDFSPYHAGDDDEE